MTALFFEDCSSDALVPSASLILSPALSHYLSKVLRLKVGAALGIFNGDGHRYHVSITELGKHGVKVQILQQTVCTNESPLHTHLLQGVSKGERMELAIRKAVECGVNEITPLLSEHCVVKLNAERWAKKLEHWRKIIISACEQCGRCTVPQLHPPLAFEAAVKLQADVRLIPTVLPAEKLKMPAYAGTTDGAVAVPSSAAVCIGPEGGFSKSELYLAEQHAWQPISLGPRVLRTETAPIVALSLLQSKWGDLI